jgi:Na+/pantothenate symporter
MLGPALAQIIYTGTNYNFGLTFYIIAGIITLFMFLALFLLPNTLNKRAVRYENN